MYENPEKIGLALYFGTKTIDKDGRFVYKPFPTLQHIEHEIFTFAFKYNFLNAYHYEVGEYMPYSPLVEKGIKENFVYNPIFDCYECNVPYDKEFDLWINKNQAYKNELQALRKRCEMYTAPELYLILFEHEKPYIKNLRKRDTDIHLYRNKISKTLGGMRFNWEEGNRITEEKYNKMNLLFDKFVNLTS